MGASNSFSKKPVTKIISLSEIGNKLSGKKLSINRNNIIEKITIIQPIRIKSKLFDKFISISIAHLQNMPIFANKTNTNKS